MQPEQSMELREIRSWFDSKLGDRVLSVERAVLEQLLPGFFGYHLLQISVQQESLYDASPIQHKVSMGIEVPDHSPFIGDATALPLPDDSMDVVLLHHVLDFYKDRQQILREIARVSIPMGHLIIVGFNPFSLWGLWKAMAFFGNRPPWNAAFIRAGRLMDWLNLLNFTIDRAHYCTYGPPMLFRDELPDYTRGISRGVNWPLGAVYVIVARKQVGAMTPIRPLWRSRNAFGKLTVVRPTGRGIATRNSQD